MSAKVKRELALAPRSVDAGRSSKAADAIGSYDPAAATRGSYDPAAPATIEATGDCRPVVAVADDVLDVAGATQLLRIGRNMVYELVARNAIPHRRLGKQIRFSRAAIMRWLDSWSLRIAKEGQ
jgi:excisionase family DNA binding protein